MSAHIIEQFHCTFVYCSSTNDSVHQIVRKHFSAESAKTNKAKVDRLTLEH